MIRHIIFLYAALILTGCEEESQLAKTDYTQYVNTFIGTDGTGHTFPGACMPFGMVQPGPDNADRGWEYASGYQYRDTVILGFSQTRANGTGINEFGDVLLQPVTDNRIEGFGQIKLKTSESASPGYYTVTLQNKVRVELTATERVAFHQYSYPGHQAKLLVDLQHGLRFLTDSLVLESNVQIENDTTIYGYCHTRNWVERKYFFVIRFSQPFYAALQLERKPQENAPRYVLSFNLKDMMLKAKIALSTVSVSGAENNLQRELPGWDFMRTVSNAKNSWNKYLSMIDIEGDKRQKEIFYTCLYRLFIQPANIADADGRYRGADDSIRTAEHGEYYSMLSLWDTYRAANPLYTILVPEKVSGLVNTMIAHSKAAGFLPIWTAWGQDNYCMIGNHAIPVIADAYLKGIPGFDAEDALREMIKSTTVNHINSNWSLLDKYGYYPFDSLDNEAVSRTLEHGVDDYCIALMADKMGKQNIGQQYYKRSMLYKNLYDSTTQQMRGKDSKGYWRTPFNPLIATSPLSNPGDYTEANAWQYFWTPAQYDIAGMIQLLGGKKKFTAQLDSFFSIQTPHPNKYLGQEAMIGQYAHGNEPSHHIAYLYAYAEKPERGRQIITQICNQFYGNTPDGMIGNDDCGQMSAWYIFSTLGFYPVNPASGEYVFGMPQVKKAVIYLSNGKSLTIENEMQDSHQVTACFDGQPVSNPFIEHATISKGGVLVFK
ncbi:MAG: GH92 family glycosyl hydrolase [Chitinophagales bacterium]|nr:GH92 family glycosyl hydrolase [Chitinophagales bacterium]